MKYIISLICVCWVAHSNAQVSIYDCGIYGPITEGEINNSGAEFYRPCVMLDGNYNFNGASSKKITSATSIDVKPGFNAGNYTGNGGMHLKIKPKSDFDVAFMNYAGPDFILRYQKMELGVTLPQPYKDKLDLFIANELNPSLNSNPSDMINPFMENELDIEATFTHGETGTVKTLDAFFTRDMVRNEASRYWDALNTEYHMRVRFAPPNNGAWTCVVKIKINNVEIGSSSAFNFNVIESGKHGYVTVHENKKNFALDGEVIFPVGQNLPHTDKYQLIPSGEVDLFNMETGTEFQNDINGWKNYIKTIDDFGNVGGRFTRIFAAPHAGLVEWEEKGNYFRRMHQAYEMDNVINTLEQHDMFTIFDLLLHNYFMIYSDYNNWQWDWDRRVLCGDTSGCGPGVNVGDYFYPDAQHEPWQLNYSVHPYNPNPGDYTTNPNGVKYPHDMFMLEEDLKFHEQRVRYYISRYGYSTQIYIWEQLEEPFHLSQDASLAGTTEPYRDQNHPLHDEIHVAVNNYTSRMNAFVRDHLQHKHQLLGLNAVFELGRDNRISEHDYSITDSRVDCVGLNAYMDLPYSYLNGDHENPDNNNKYYYNEESFLAKVSVFGNNFRGIIDNPFPTFPQEIKRPVYISESGKAWDEYLGYDDCQAGTDEFLDNMRLGFCGFAGFNKWHKYKENKFGVWENIVRAEQHMNGQDVQRVINTDYIQGRQQEGLNFGSLVTPNTQGKVLEMQYYLSEDRNSAVGYVHNRTVNYRTAGPAGNCKSQPFLKKNFNNIVNIDWTDDGPFKKLKLDDLLAFSKYQFVFYSYPNGTYLSSFTNSTGANDQIKVEFPELTKQNAVVWFVCKKIPKKKSTLIADDDQELPNGDVVVYPNPTTGSLFVSKKDGAFEVYNSLGMKMAIPAYDSGREELLLDFANLSKGIYLIHFIESAQTIKICLL